MARRAQNPLVRYFADIWAGIATTYVGMRLTLGYFFSKPVTMRYPEERPAIPPTHRGLHAYDESKCNACRLCARLCPVECIALETAGRGKDVLVLRYDIDYSKCLFCNLCAESCPTSCLRLTEQYDLACGSREGCVLHLARPKTDAEIEALKELIAKKDAERKALQAQKEAERLAKQQETDQKA